MGGSVGAVAAVGRGAPPVLGSTVTRPSGATAVFPPGSGNDPCRNQPGDPPSANPCVGGCVCANASDTMRIVPSATAANRAELHLSIFGSPVFLVERLVWIYCHSKD